MILIHKVVLRIKAILAWRIYFEAPGLFYLNSITSVKAALKLQDLFYMPFPFLLSLPILSLLPPALDRSSLCGPGWPHSWGDPPAFALGAQEGVLNPTAALLPFLQFEAFVDIHNNLIATTLQKCLFTLSFTLRGMCLSQPTNINWNFINSHHLVTSRI